MQHLPGGPQHPSSQPLAIPQPQPPTQRGVLSGTTAPAQLDGHPWVKPALVASAARPPGDGATIPREGLGSVGMHLQSLRHQGLIFYFFIYFFRSLKFSNCGVEMLFDSPPISAEPPPPWPPLSSLSCIHSVRLLCLSPPPL